MRLGLVVMVVRMMRERERSGRLALRSGTSMIVVRERPGGPRKRASMGVLVARERPVWLDEAVTRSTSCVCSDGEEGQEDGASGEHTTG